MQHELNLNQKITGRGEESTCRTLAQDYTGSPTKVGLSPDKPHVDPKEFQVNTYFKPSSSQKIYRIKKPKPIRLSQGTQITPVRSKRHGEQENEKETQEDQSKKVDLFGAIAMKIEQCYQKMNNTQQKEFFVRPS